MGKKKGLLFLIDKTWRVVVKPTRKKSDGVMGSAVLYRGIVVVGKRVALLSELWFTIRVEIAVIRCTVDHARHSM